MKITRHKSQVKIIKLFTFYFLLFTFLTGCEAFVRKFTRKPKRDNLAREEMVLAPEEYQGPQMTREDIYRKYFLFWRSWHDELIVSLSQNTNQKRRIDCVNEALSNLANLKTLLNEWKQKILESHIHKLSDLRDSIASDIYSNKVDINRQNAERIKRNILRDLSYQKIKDSLL